MGLHFADQYSILHFSVGSVAYFWNLSFMSAIFLHTVFELVENTDIGMSLINKYFIHPGYFSWPGGKNYADSKINMLGDTIFFALGWLISAFLDVTGTQRKWYEAHPKNIKLK